MGKYEGLIPIVILFVILSVEPQGIMEIQWRNLSVNTIKEGIIRFRRAMKNILYTE